MPFSSKSGHPHPSHVNGMLLEEELLDDELLLLSDEELLLLLSDEELLLELVLMHAEFVQFIKYG